MTSSLSDYLMRDFVIERVHPRLYNFGCAGSVQFPSATRAYFHLVLAGHAQVALNDSKSVVELARGDCVFLLYGAAHRLWRTRQTPVLQTADQWPVSDAPVVSSFGNATADTRVLSASVQLTRVLRSAPVNRALPHILRSDEHNSRLVDPKLVEAACRGPGASAFAFSLAQLSLTQMLRQVHDDLQEVLPMTHGAPDLGRMAAIVRRIREHPDQRWTVASLAREVGWSRSTFAAKFQAYAGVGPITYATQTRLARAQAMLRGNPELPLWEVARRVGYDVQGSFTRAFKAQFGVSPREYALRLRNGN